MLLEVNSLAEYFDAKRVFFVLSSPLEDGPNIF
jgi:hypothetical protein